MEELIYDPPSLVGVIDHGPKQNIGPLDVEEISVSGVHLVRLIDPHLGGEDFSGTGGHPVSIGACA